uniref:SRCR domain-containing protein n=1 Tax=Capitella teleta TaxID=283909 RepID=X2BDC7_CAPTE
MRLTGGSTSNIGRLEVFHRGEWGTVCDDDFTDEAAAVFCKTLGLPYANADALGNYGGGYSLPILLDQVTCHSAIDARYCRHRGWKIHDCTTNENVGISWKHTRLRLIGSTSNIGRLEVFHRGEWRTVCGDDFTDEAAAVFCKALGLPYSNATAILNFGGGHPFPILLDQVTCQSSKDARYCRHGGWRDHDCTTNENLGLSCL